MTEVNLEVTQEPTVEIVVQEQTVEVVEVSGGPSDLVELVVETTTAETLLQVESQVEVIEVAVPGPAGPPGPPGPPGTDLTYLHEQPVAATVWEITHNLGKYPSVTQFDTSGNRMWGKVIYTSQSTVEIHHSVIVSGYASLN